jgi:hypothetical protein
VLQAIKKFVNTRGRVGTRFPHQTSSPRDAPEQLSAAAECHNAVTSCTEDCKSNVTAVTWLDDVRDLEDMENHLNEALELKMKEGLLTSVHTLHGEELHSLYS